MSCSQSTVYVAALVFARRRVRALGPFAPAPPPALRTSGISRCKLARISLIAAAASQPHRSRATRRRGDHRDVRAGAPADLLGRQADRDRSRGRARDQRRQALGEARRPRVPRRLRLVDQGPRLEERHVRERRAHHNAGATGGRARAGRGRAHRREPPAPRGGPRSPQPRVPPPRGRLRHRRGAGTSTRETRSRGAGRCERAGRGEGRGQRARGTRVPCAFSTRRASSWRAAQLRSPTASRTRNCSGR